MDQEVAKRIVPELHHIHVEDPLSQSQLILAVVQQRCFCRLLSPSYYRHELGYNVSGFVFVVFLVSSPREERTKKRDRQKGRRTKQGARRKKEGKKERNKPAETP